MVWVLVAVVVVVAAVIVSRRLEARKKETLRIESVRKVARVAEEDITRFGEELMVLDSDTLSTSLDDGMRQDYQRALDSYETAGRQLRDVQEADDVAEVTRTLEDGRYALACVRARVAGEPLPTRRPPCFFNPAHGPALTDVLWAPPGGIKRDVPVCMADADRVAQGAEPDTRKVQLGGRMVPWYQGGPAYGPYAGGYYGAYAMNGLFPAFILGSMLGGSWGGSDTGGDSEGDGGDSGADAGADAAADQGADYGGEWDTGWSQDPSAASGFDGGGYDGGGFDGGGGYDGGGYDGGGDFGGGGFDGGGFGGGDFGGF